jgi:phospholipid-binding lipoprotein MlaA
MKSKVSLLQLCQRVVALGAALVLAGCATSKNNVDPYEKYNRAVFKFNRGLDYVAFRPAADLYDTLMPVPIQGGVGRMWTNFYEPSRVINDILQGEMRYAYQDSARFVLNTTLGVAGYFDVAQHMGFAVHQQDFGVTMARWGWKQSAYLVVPLLGIYTVRDFVAVPANVYVFTFWPYIQPENLAWKLYFLEKLQTRAELRQVDKVIDEAFDPYLFVRDAYLQKRQETIAAQQNGRKAQVQPAVEHAEDEVEAGKGGAQAAAVSGQQGATAPASSKAGSKKDLPDVLS